MRPHPLFTNYLITKDGNVINKKTNRKLKPSPNERGYLMVGLRKDKKQHTKKIHRLVMETYEPIENAHLYDAHHKNEIKSDNHLENLEWELKGKHISKHHKGKVLSDETRRKISEAKKGVRRSDETRRKIGEGNKGKVISEETRRKLSEARLGKPNQCLVGKVWWNDGTKTIRSKTHPGEGWMKGRM